MITKGDPWDEGARMHRYLKEEHYLVNQIEKARK